MKHNEDAIRKLEELVANGEPRLVATPSIFELFSGTVRSRKPTEEKQKILDTLTYLDIIPLEYESAKKAGEIDGSLIMRGAMIGVADCMIAGIALVHEERVLTRNVKDFRKVEELGVEVY